jgi:hypothetical protein
VAGAPEFFTICRGAAGEFLIGNQDPADNLFQDSGIQPDACAPGAAKYFDTLPVGDLQFRTA